MRHMIKIGDKDLEFNSTALTSIAYKKTFGSDFLLVLNNDSNFTSDVRLTETIKQLAFIMNMQAEHDDISFIMSLQMLDYWKWINQFNFGDFESDGVMVQLIQTWTNSMNTMVEAKNASGAQ